MQRITRAPTDRYGNVLFPGTVTVTLTGTDTKADLFSDDGVTPQANPFTYSSDQGFAFYVESGRYDIQVEVTGYLPTTEEDVSIFDPVDGITAGEIVAAIGYTPEDAAHRSDDENLGISTTLYPNQRAVKAYADTGDAASVTTAEAYTDDQLTGYVPKTTTINGHALATNVVITATDVGAPDGSGTSTGTNTGDQDLSGYVPTTRTVNGHALSADVTVSKSDVGLGNADNTSDANKPVSTAQAAADAAVLASAQAYADSVAQGLSVKQSCRLATAAALPANSYSNGSSGVGATITALSVGALTVDGQTVALNDRLLVKDEGSALENGIYKCTTAGAVGVLFVLTRVTDLDQSAEFPGAFTFIEAGTVNADAGFVCSNTSNPTVGTDSISFTQFSGAGSITAGTGLTKSGNTLSLTVPVTVALGGTNSTAALNNNRVMQSSGGAVVEAAAITASRALVSDANGIPTHSATTSTELGYVSGVTSAIQTQLGTKAASGANTDITSMALDQTGLKVKGGSSNKLTIKPNETLSAERILNIKVNDVDRTVDLSGNLTVPSAATVSGTNTGDQTSVTGNAGTATTLQTARTIDGQSFDGSANITVIAPGTHAASSKTTPVDADELPLVDTEASNVLKKLTGTNLKAYLKSYFDTLYTSSGASVGSIVGLWMCGGINLPQNATRYCLGIGKAINNTEANAVIYPGRPVRAYELRVHLSAAVPASNTLVVTVRRNGVATSLTCTVTAGNTDASDLSNTADFGTGDQLTVECVTSATFGTTNDVTVTLRGKIPGTSIDCGFGIPASAIGSTPGANAYSAGYPDAQAQVTESAAEVPLAACLLGPVREHGGNGVAQQSVTIRRNGVTAGNATQGDIVPFAANDLYNCRYTATDGLTMNASVDCRVNNSSGGEPGQYAPLLFSVLSQVQNVTRYLLSYGDNQSGGTATEGDAIIPMPACTLNTLRCAASSAPAAGQTITITVRKGTTNANMADTSMVVTIDSTGREQTTTSNPVTFVSGDLMSLKSVTSATSGTRSVTACCEFS